MSKRQHEVQLDLQRVEITQRNNELAKKEQLVFESELKKAEQDLKQAMVIVEQKKEDLIRKETEMSQAEDRIKVSQRQRLKEKSSEIDRLCMLSSIQALALELANREHNLSSEKEQLDNTREGCAEQARLVQIQSAEVEEIRKRLAAEEVECRDNKEKQSTFERHLSEKDRQLRQKDRDLERQKMEVSQRAAQLAVSEKYGTRSKHSRVCVLAAEYQNERWNGWKPISRFLYAVYCAYAQGA